MKSQNNKKKTLFAFFFTKFDSTLALPISFLYCFMFNFWHYHSKTLTLSGLDELQQEQQHHNPTNYIFPFSNIVSYVLSLALSQKTSLSRIFNNNYTTLQN